ncbi:MAG: outer membrane protein transport protein [Cytophagales bacterium]|nr:outer membrane protein transport protein [Cytophagales bacterium]
MMISRVYLFLTFALLSESLFATGYQVLLQGNRQAAMGNLGVALNPDASSVFWNPGALAFMDFNQLTAGGNLIFATNSYWDSSSPGSQYTARTKNDLGTPFFLYAAWSPAGWPVKFAAGFYTPFGNRVNWGDWNGRGILREVNLASFYMQPTVSWKITDRLSVGGGVILAFGRVELNRSLPIDYNQGNATAAIEGNADLKAGFNVGILFKASEKINIGASYRSKIKMEVKDGETHFDIPASLAPNLFGPGVNYEAITFDASLPLPAAVNLGVAYMPDSKVTISFEASLTEWSEYQFFALEYSSPVLGESRQSSPRSYENSWAVKLGASYKMNGKFTFRAGAYYDESPVQKGYLTPETPDQDRFNMTAGLSFRFAEDWTMDLAYLWVNGQKRQQSYEDGLAAGTIVAPDPGRGISGFQAIQPGTYRSWAHIAGFSLSYTF